MLSIKWLLLAAGMSIAAPLHAQLTAVPMPSAPPQKVVEGDTPDRVAQIERCQGHKFESLVEIDPATKRSTRVKLCADPGASNADWVKTLEAAVAQIEQRDMPAAAKDKLIGELRAEIGKYPAATQQADMASGISLSSAEAGSPLTEPTERFETSTLPSLAPPKKMTAAGGGGVAAASPRPMRVTLKCLERGQSGAGATCDFFESSTILVVRAVEGLEEGGVLRFRRKGDQRGEVALAPMPAGRSTRVKLPSELCRGISSSKIEIELFGPKSAGAAAVRFGPYGLRC